MEMNNKGGLQARSSSELGENLGILFSSLFGFLVMMFSFWGPLSVSVWGPLLTPFFLVNAVLAVGVFLFSRREKKIHIGVASILMGYVVFVVVGLFSAYVNFAYFPSLFLEGLIGGRLFTCTSVVLTVFCVFVWCKNATIAQRYRYLEFALWICIIFALVGVWQWSSFWFDIPFPFETRTGVHGVNEDLRALVGNRVTSLAREPNFYSPIIVEGLILAWLLLDGTTRVAVLSLMVVVGIATFSTGFYMHLMFMSACVFVVQIVKKPMSIRLLLILLTLLLMIVSVLILRETFIWDFVVSKMENEAGGRSIRSKIILEAIFVYLNGDVTQLLFGFGLNSLEYNSYLKGAGEFTHEVFPITNNLFLDIIYQTGMIGLALFWFSPLVFVGIIAQRVYINNFYYAAFLLLISYFVVGLYRSDYASSHYAWFVSLIIVSYSLGRDSILYSGAPKATPNGFL